MDDQRDEARSEAPQWDSVRGVREPLAWLLLALTAIGLVIGAGELLGLLGTPVVAGPGPVSVTSFAFRASAVAPEFVAFGIIALPVASVILVAFCGGLTDHGPQVVRSAVLIQAITLGLGVLSWLGTVDSHPHLRPGVWCVSYLLDLAVAATTLTFTVAVLRSSPLQSRALRFHDFGEADDDLPEED
jgi:hypothetical protein